MCSKHPKELGNIFSKTMGTAHHSTASHLACGTSIRSSAFKSSKVRLVDNKVWRTGMTWAPRRILTVFHVSLNEQAPHFHDLALLSKLVLPKNIPLPNPMEVNQARIKTASDKTKHVAGCRTWCGAPCRCWVSWSMDANTCDASKLVQITRANNVRWRSSC